jgi:hypothetical protein
MFSGARLSSYCLAATRSITFFPLTTIELECLMGKTKDFSDKPTTFLETHVIVVASQEEATSETPSTTPRNFYLTPQTEGGNVFLLKEYRFGKKPEELISAYWLPWLKNKAVSMTLGTDAEFFFTSEMTNCRFSVLTSDANTPTVAHVAGNVSSSKRDQLEKGKGFPDKKEIEPNKKVRRLSISGSSEHGYKGQRSTYEESSSPFVFGYRAEGVWKFYAQIVGGLMSGDSIDSKLIRKTVESNPGLFHFQT